MPLQISLGIAKQQFKPSATSTPASWLVRSTHNLTEVRWQCVGCGEFMQVWWSAPERRSIGTYSECQSPNSAVIVAEESQSVPSSVLIECR